jgi:iron complex transport system substrate-binding protein
MRVVTLLPAATEMVCAVGGEHQLVGISHACDFPPRVTHLPRVTRTPVPATLPGGAIHRMVRELRDAGRPVIEVDGELLRQLRPDLVVTQDLCDVCAVADGETRRLVELLDPAPRVLTLEARDLAGIFRDIRRVGEVLELDAEADEVVAGLQYRLRRLGRDGPPLPPPRVVCVEWLDPIYLAGHWVPDLIAAAGGVNVGPPPGTPSTQYTLPDLQRLHPDVVLVMLCGFDVARAREEMRRSPLPDLGVPVHLLDGNAYTSRPGPRVLEAAEHIHRLLRARRPQS